MDALLGTTLGGYTLKSLIGSGGMGTVYLAEDPAIGQQVAIKLVHTDALDVSESLYTTRVRERFRQEARAIAALDHPHILPLYRYGEEETTVGLRAYMIMQYRPEGSLSDWLRGRAGLAHSSMPLPPVSLFSGLPASWPLPPVEVAEYVRQAASALQYAHDRGIIHRDVKPANFLLRTDVDSGAPQDSKVLLLLSDFGLAEFYASSSSTTSVFGTPMYMSPEQFDGHAVPASDQYALAITAYYLLAGRLPFEGEPIHLMRQHLDAAPPSILTHVPSLPAEIDSVLAQALAKQPAERFSSISHFAQAFTQAIDEQGNTQPQRRQPSSKVFLRRITTPRLTTIKPPYRAPASPVAAPTLEESVHTAGDHITPDETKTPPDPLLTPLVQARRTVRSEPEIARSEPELAPSTPPSVQAVKPSRPKRRRALGWIVGGTTALVVLGAGAGLYFNIAGIDDRLNVPQLRPSPNANKRPQPVHSAIRYTLRGHTGEVTSVSWSPDGKMLASASVDTTVRLWNSSTHQTTQTYRGHNKQVLSVAWNNGGDQLASGGQGNTVHVWNTAAQMTHGPFDLGAAVKALAWTNDEANIFASSSDNQMSEVMLSGDTVAQTPINLPISTLAISPDGHSLAVGTVNGLVAIFALADLTMPATPPPPGGPQQPGPRPIYSNSSHQGVVSTLSWSPDNSLLASGGDDKQVAILDVAALSTRASLIHTSPIRGIAWHPTDTNRIATIVGDNMLRIWTLNASTNTEYQAPNSILTSIGWHTQELATGTSSGTIIVWNVS